MNFFELWRWVAKFAPLVIPPDIDDEQGLRTWLANLMVPIGELADITGTCLDDEVVEVLAAIVESDEVWAPVYVLIKHFVPEDVPDDENKVGAAINAATDLKGFNPLTILAIVKFVAEIIRMFREQ